MDADNFKFYQELGEKYPETKLQFPPNVSIPREAYLSKLLVAREGLTLDLGCCDGHYKKYIKRYVGLDVSLPRLKKFKGNRVWGTALHLPFRNECFDTVFASEVLEHIINRKQTVREIHRILKPKGEFIMSAPYGLYPYAETWSPILEKYGVQKHYYIHGRFCEEYVEVLLEQNGFKIKLLRNNKNVRMFAVGEKQ